METLDDKVKKLFDLVQEKKSQIAKLEKPSYKTNMSFPTADGNRVNLQTVNDPVALIKILASLKNDSTAFNGICKEKGWDFEYKHANFPYADWEADITTLINRINIKKMKDDLADKENKLNALLSPEKKRELEFAALEKELLGDNTK
jgi:hypothetical protein